MGVKKRTKIKPEWENKEQPVSNEDLQILQSAREILSDESKWNSDDDRVCNEDDTKWSLFCALKKATIEIDRKVLAELAVNQPEIFKDLVEKSQSAR